MNSPYNKPIKLGTAKAWLSSASLHKFSQALSASYWGVIPTWRVMSKLTISNPRSDWVAKELTSIIKEWESWQEDVANIEDHAYDPNTQLDVFLDGEENMEKHSILQMKTITFLDNNVINHWFIKGRGCDRTDLRLKVRVKT